MRVRNFKTLRMVRTKGVTKKNNNKKQFQK